MTNNITVESILSTLSVEAISELRSHFRSEVASELTGTIKEPVTEVVTKEADKKEANKKVKKVLAVKKVSGQNRQHTNDGTERSASQFIRDCGEEMSVKDIVESASKVGLDIETSLIYNVRAQLKKKENSLKELRNESARKAVLAMNAQKARAARKEKIEAAKVEVSKIEEE